MRRSSPSLCACDDAQHQFVWRYIQRGGRRDEVYPGIRRLLKDLAPSVSPFFRDLARILHLNLFVTTTFDSVLAQAVDGERFSGAPRAGSLAYSPNSSIGPVA